MPNPSFAQLCSGLGLDLPIVYQVAATSGKVGRWSSRVTGAQADTRVIIKLMMVCFLPRPSSASDSSFETMRHHFYPIHRRPKIGYYDPF